ncbi:hypothetical protein D3C81_2127200 [compost metagenome]
MARVIEFILDLLRDIACESERFSIVNLLRLNHYAHFTARLNGVRFFNAFERFGNVLKLLQTLNVRLECFAARSWPCSG